MCGIFCLSPDIGTLAQNAIQPAARATTRTRRAGVSTSSTKYTRSTYVSRSAIDTAGTMKW